MSNYLLSTYSRINLSFTHGKGSWLYTSDNKKYLDFASGIAVNCLGHSNPVLLKALNKQSRKLWHTSNLYNIKEQEDLAKELCKKSFADKVFFCNSGAEATEGLIKIARKYHYIQAKYSKKEIIVLENAFHGRTITGIQAGSNLSHKEGFIAKQDCSCGFIKAPFGDITELKKKINSKTAAIFFEPIQGEGGINVAPKNYLESIRKICNENNILMILDEVQCGIGRTGKTFAYEWWKAKPDMVGLAKGLGGGFPIGAIMLSNKIAKHITPGSHGSTFGGNQLACAVSLAVIKEISKRKTLNNVIDLGIYLKKEINKIILRDSTTISEVFGKGLMIGIKCRKSNLDLTNDLRKQGLLVVPASNNVIRLLPPLNINKKEAKKAITIISGVVSEFK
jgi:acetylornithine/N-succinyldiaminopimelate aminotransferase